MTAFYGINDNSNQSKDISWFKLTDFKPGETANSVTMYGGNDTVIGSSFTDIISGGYGNDSLKGMAGNDFLNGEDGNDTLLGGTGNDSLHGGAGIDSLNGEAGIDYLYGGAGNDTYIHGLNSGNDLVNDNITVTGATGSGGGYDSLIFSGIRFDQIVAGRSGNNLILTSVSDQYTLTDCVLIENYFLGGNFKIEVVGGYDASYAVNFV